MNKFKDGENRIRILGDRAEGFQIWSPQDNRMFKGTSRNELAEYESDKNWPKETWVMPVWDYAEQAVRILSINQKSIREGLQELEDDADWGSTQGYDVVINKSGTGLETRYSVVPKPAKPVDAAITSAFEQANIDVSGHFKPRNTTGPEEFDPGKMGKSNPEPYSPGDPNGY